MCIGEGLEVRRAGATYHTLAQVDGSLAGFSADQVAELVVAYEPVWAIGTGESRPRPTRRRCTRRSGSGSGRSTVTRRRRGTDPVRRSVKAANVAGSWSKIDIDGALVGGASLQVDEFGGIYRFYDMPLL